VNRWKRERLQEALATAVSGFVPRPNKNVAYGAMAKVELRNPVIVYVTPSLRCSCWVQGYVKFKLDKIGHVISS